MLASNKEEEEVLPRCRGVRRRRCASAALVRGCEQRRCCARWRAVSLVLCVLERKRKKKEGTNECGGGNSALSLLFMGDLRRSCSRDFLRMIP